MTNGKAPWLTRLKKILGKKEGPVRRQEYPAPSRAFFLDAFNSESVPFIQYPDAHAYKNIFPFGSGRFNNCGHIFSHGAEPACCDRICKAVCFRLRDDRVN